ncbi:hypothetical protein [Devosia sp. 1566]|uniref:hypothetical protein n=1 Tax=Devosia sp. 1566 TaxID=2499144 RepID=UPI000FD82DF8|nr:hypothetical protein [Devosia sp. 1566]
MPARDGWQTHVFPLPKAIAVAKLVTSHGIDAAAERWHHVEPRTLYKRGRAGSCWSAGRKPDCKR